ncbi:hypothetical protein TWF718_002978 [Orbilia javanica]|uniref:F-box domain-containing protein n=1 Tax=Orbilia javanica TaxID=47235 RepID=A0AAN8MFC4_9PEZI
MAQSPESLSLRASSFFPTLPTETLIQIFSYNLLDGDTSERDDTPDFKFSEALRLSLVCRRFHSIITNFRLSRCDVGLCNLNLWDNLSFSTIDGFIVSFLRFGGGVFEQKFSAASNILDLYRASGRRVSHLSFILFDRVPRARDEYTRPHRYPGGLEVKLPGKDEFLTTGARLPVFISSLTEMFPNLTTIDLSEKYSRYAYVTRPDYLIPTLKNILHSCHNLKDLKLALLLDVGVSPSLAVELESLLPIPTSRVKLQTLTLIFQFIDFKAMLEPYPGIWLLSALGCLLPASVTALERLHFEIAHVRLNYDDIDNGTGYLSDAGRKWLIQAALAKRINQLDRSIPLPVLRRLKISVQYLAQKFTNIHTLHLNEDHPWLHYPSSLPLLRAISSSTKNIKTIIVYHSLRMSLEEINAYPEGFAELPGRRVGLQVLPNFDWMTGRHPVQISLYNI